MWNVLRADLAQLRVLLFLERVGLGGELEGSGVVGDGRRLFAKRLDPPIKVMDRFCGLYDPFRHVVKGHFPGSEGSENRELAEAVKALHVLG